MDRPKSWADGREPEAEGPASDNVLHARPRFTQLQVASAYCFHGFRIFPCGKDKAPRVKDNLNRATRFGRQIRNWWSTWPDALIGLPCAENGLVVVDFDLYKPGKESCLADLEVVTGLNLGAHPYQVRTARGGLHLYFKCPKDLVVKSGVDVLGDGVDVRAAGGYVIAADGRDYNLLGAERGFSSIMLRDVPELPEEIRGLLTRDTPNDAPPPDRNPLPSPLRSLI